MRHGLSDFKLFTKAMDSEEVANGVDVNILRQRNAPQSANSPEQAKETVQELNAEEEEVDQGDEKEKKTFGRTPDGVGELSYP